jgi:hypothetical protein
MMLVRELGRICESSVARFAADFSVPSWGVVLVGLVAGFCGYSGTWYDLPLAMLAILAWGITQARHQAFFVMTAYYLAASRGLFHGGGVFFAGTLSPTSLSWPWGLCVWIVPSVVLAWVWAVCWGRRALAWRTVVAVIIVSVPPIGFFGWASPLAGLGVWLPGMSWAGVAVGLLAAGLLARAGQAFSAPRYPDRRLSRREWGGIGMCLVASAIALFGHGLAPALPAPAGWVGVDTSLGKVDGYEALSRIELATEDAVRSGARLVLLPEAVGGLWDLNSLYWAPLNERLQAKGVGVLLGAEASLDKVQRKNALFGVGTLHGQVVGERIPVPLGMWAPWSKTRHIVSDWDGPGVVDLPGHRAMVLICYEQFLTWPVLASAAHHPDVILAAANLWWASGTSLPEIQVASVRAWARLFNLSVVQARNMAP